MRVELVVALIEACKQFNTAAEGPSHDAEHEAARRLRDVALDILRGDGVEFSDLLAEYDADPGGAK